MKLSISIPYDDVATMERLDRVKDELRSNGQEPTTSAAVRWALANCRDALDEHKKENPDVRNNPL